MTPVTALKIIYISLLVLGGLTLLLVIIALLVYIFSKNKDPFSHKKLSRDFYVVYNNHTEEPIIYREQVIIFSNRQSAQYAEHYLNKKFYELVTNSVLEDKDIDHNFTLKSVVR